jgi:hypothetical protein
MPNIADLAREVDWDKMDMMSEPELQAMLGQLDAHNEARRITPEQARKIIMRPKGMEFVFVPPGEEGESKEEFIRRATAWLQSDEGAESAEEVDTTMHEQQMVAQTVLNEGQLIDLGVAPSRAGIAKEGMRALKMLKAGVLPHPFADGYMFLMAGPEIFSQLILVLPRPDEDDPLSFYLAYYQPEAEFGNTNNVRFIYRSDGKVGFTGDSVLIQLGSMFADERDYPEREDSLVQAIMYTLYGLLLLNTRFVEVDRVGTADKLNDARRRRGKAPLPSYLRVQSQDYVTAVDGHRRNSVRVEGGGTHASPLPHKRRAHIREFKEPTKDGKLQVLVREAHINMKKGRFAASSRSHYRVMKTPLDDGDNAR